MEVATEWGGALPGEVYQLDISKYIYAIYTMLFVSVCAADREDNKDVVAGLWWRPVWCESVRVSPASYLALTPQL